MTYTKYLLFSILVVCPSVLSAQGITRRIHQIDEVTVWGKRPMKEIGVQKTKFDSLALKENIALSMADILTFNSSVFGQELRPRHALDRRLPRHVAQPYAGDVERDAHQQPHARHDRLLHHSVLLHRPGIAAARYFIGERNGRWTGRSGQTRHGS